MQIKKLFKISPQDLDAAALATNKIKWLYLGVTLVIGTVVVFLTDFTINYFVWMLVVNGCLSPFILPIFYAAAGKIPYCLSYPNETSSDEFSYSNIELINRAQGYGSINGYIMSARRD